MTVALYALCLACPLAFLCALVRAAHLRPDPLPPRATDEPPRTFGEAHMDTHYASLGRVHPVEAPRLEIPDLSAHTYAPDEVEPDPGMPPGTRAMLVGIDGTKIHWLPKLYPPAR